MIGSEVINWNLNKFQGQGKDIFPSRNFFFQNINQQLKFAVLNSLAAKATNHPCIWLVGGYQTCAWTSVHTPINDEWKPNIYIWIRLNAENDTSECYFTTCFGNLPFFSIEWFLWQSWFTIRMRTTRIRSIEGKESYCRWTMDFNVIHIHAYGLVALVPFLYAFLVKIHCSAINVI